MWRHKYTTFNISSEAYSLMFYDKEFIGKKFKEYRTKANLTQEELSEKIEIAEKHYGKLERGVFMPSLETFFKLIDTLNIPLSEFGIQVEIIENTNRNKLLREIYSSSDEEIALYLNIIESVKKYNSDKKY